MAPNKFNYNGDKEKNTMTKWKHEWSEMLQYDREPDADLKAEREKRLLEVLECKGGIGNAEVNGSIIRYILRRPS
jgi:hypothetical protein